MVAVRRLLVVLASASMLLASVGTASAHEETATSNVTINTSENGLKGAVGSSMKSCKKNRKVTVFKKSGQKVKTTTTNKRGKWSISLPNAEGKYYAKVKEKVGGDIVYGHVHVCLGDKSPTIKV